MKRTNARSDTDPDELSRSTCLEAGHAVAHVGLLGEHCYDVQAFAEPEAGNINLDPLNADERHALYNALFAATGLPTPSLPLNPDKVSSKYFTYGERHLQTYRARIQAIADVVARFAAEDAK